MDIIRRILGEAEADEKEKKPKAEKPEPKSKPEPKAKAEADGPATLGTPEDTQVNELAQMWPGNREEVVSRYMAMSNQEAVKLVFAIGREGAIELARIVDERLEQQGGDEEDGAFAGEEGIPGEDLATTEPASVETPEEAEGYPARQILGVGR